MPVHWVRLGTMGLVTRCQAAEGLVYARGAAVVVRTPRGLEVGEVLTVERGRPTARGDALPSGESDAGDQEPAERGGEIVRPVSEADRLVLERLERHREAALADCSARIIERGLAVSLLDVEHLLDGQTLVFHFLGESTAELDALARELTETYEARVQVRRFTTAVNEGCGPDCGSAAAGAEHGCGSCAATGCGLAAACGVPRGSG